MLKRNILQVLTATIFGLFLSTASTAQNMDKQSQATFDTVMSFMTAMGTGDMDTMGSLMADDMVWQNGGDATMPWIGPWDGKEAIFQFLGVFMGNVETTLWETEDAFARGDTFASFGRMKLKLTKSGQSTEVFDFALRVKVKDGQIVLWNWFEDSYAVSNAFHGK